MRLTSMMAMAAVTAVAMVVLSPMATIRRR